MNNMEQRLRAIYNKLGDETSKEIFTNRLLYNTFGEQKYLDTVIKTVSGGSEHIERLAQLKQSNKNVYIFGAGIWGKELCMSNSCYPWKAFIDTNPKADTCCGLPVIRYSDFVASYDGGVVFISSRLYYNEMFNQLVSDGIPKANIVNFCRMNDELSKMTYFDLPYIDFNKNNIFVDCGSFDGLTAIEFVKKAGGGAFVYAFEPDSLNAQKCADNLKKYSIAHLLIQKGVWNENASLCFDNAGNGASRVSDAGNTKIDVTSIDEVIKENPVTFIKMDIEGSELKALIGAEQTIKRNKPTLAICIYHKHEDMWEIPEIILNYNSDYKLFIRHYTYVRWDTVLYAIP